MKTATTPSTTTTRANRASNPSATPIPTTATTKPVTAGGDSQARLRILSQSFSSLSHRNTLSAPCGHVSDTAVSDGCDVEYLFSTAEL